MANRKRLTDRALQALKPAKQGQRYTIYDDLTPGLGLRVTDGGVMTWVVLRRFKGKPVRITLRGDDGQPGRFPGMGLKEARERALQTIRDMIGGNDPRQTARRQKQEQAQRDRQTFGSVARAYLNERKSRRSFGQIEALVKPLIEEWDALPVAQIARSDVSDYLQPLKEKRHHVAFNRRLTIIRAIFDHALNEEMITTNPAGRVKMLDEAPRDRVLTDDEIRKIWGAVADLDYPARPLVRLLLATGLRLREVANARRSEIDQTNKLWLIPAERMKGGIAHAVPLTPLITEVLDDLPNFGGELLFPALRSNGKVAGSPIGGFSWLKRRIDEKAGFDDWVFHDLRRSMRTNLSRLRVDSDVAEALLAHVKPGIQRVYDHWKLLDEKRAALELWHRLLLDIASGRRSGNVVELPLGTERARGSQ